MYQDPAVESLSEVDVTHSLEFLDLGIGFQFAKLGSEEFGRVELTWLKETEQTEELIDIVLQRSSSQQDTVLLSNQNTQTNKYKVICMLQH